MHMERVCVCERASEILCVYTCVCTRVAGRAREIEQARDREEEKCQREMKSCPSESSLPIAQTAESNSARFLFSLSFSLSLHLSLIQKSLCRFRSPFFLLSLSLSFSSPAHTAKIGSPCIFFSPLLISTSLFFTAHTARPSSACVHSCDRNEHAASVQVFFHECCCECKRLDVHGVYVSGLCACVQCLVFVRCSWRSARASTHVCVCA